MMTKKKQHVSRASTLQQLFEGNTMTTTSTPLPRPAMMQKDGQYIGSCYSEFELGCFQKLARQWADEGSKVILRYASTTRCRVAEHIARERDDVFLQPYREAWHAAKRTLKDATGNGNSWWRAYDEAQLAHREYLNRIGLVVDFPVFR